MKWKAIIALTTCFFLFAANISAQCEVNENRFFKPGENLSYDLYFKYGLVTKKAGYASLFTQSSRYNNEPAYKMSLVSHSTGIARAAFKLDDTLVCFLNMKLRPLAFWKDAHEGNENNVERQTYSYLPNGNISIHARRVRNGVEKHNVTINTTSCTYDMMSIIYYARTLNYDSMGRGAKTNVVFISGKKKVNMQIHYLGVETVKANNGVSYSCHKLSLSILDDAFTNEQEAMKVYVTNDRNRIPVQLESKLKIGSTRAVLKSYAGLMNPVGEK